MFIGIDVGGTKCLGVTVDGKDVSEPLRFPTPDETEELLQCLVGIVDMLDSGNRGMVEGIGIGLPGWVDEDGLLQFAPNLPQLVGLDVAAELCLRVHLPVYAENDATCAAWGEYIAGTGLDLHSMLFITIGTGIGSGIVSGGRLHRGGHGFAGEVGHMIVQPQGSQCSCGQRGCWEALASGSALERLGVAAVAEGRAPGLSKRAGNDPSAVRGEHVTQAAHEGDPDATALVAELAEWVAIGLLNVANAFDPDALVLGGGLAEAGDVFFDPVRSALQRLTSVVEARPRIRLERATLGQNAGAIGAAYLADSRAGTAMAVADGPES